MTGTNIAVAILVAALVLVGGWYLIYREPPLVCTEWNRICTKDIRAVCSPDGKERKDVASNCSCGEDARSLAAKGWVDCRTSESSPDTSTWKTYRNEQYGFEVRYPENWKHEIESIVSLRGLYERHGGLKYQNAELVVSLASIYPDEPEVAPGVWGGMIELSVYANPEQLSVEEFLRRKLDAPPPAVIEKFDTKNDFEIYSASYGELTGPFVAVLERKQMLYLVEDTYSSYQDSIFRKIISTFKFIQ